MEFGPVSLETAEGAILAHSLPLPDGRLRKGRVLDSQDITRLQQAGFSEVTVARLGPHDVAEDVAAARLARLIAGAAIKTGEAATGRVNFTVSALGLARLDRQLLAAFNALDEGLTLASVQHNQLLEPGQMLATLKIIPFALPETVIEAAEKLLKKGSLLEFQTLASCKAALIQTQVSAIQKAVLTATEKVTRARLEALGSHLTDSYVTGHAVAEVATAIQAALANQADLVLICGGSAVMDRRDVVPAAIEAAGGEVTRLGLPVDPGNLLLLGGLGNVPIIGMPGCARSPRLNGFDWVLHLLLAGLPADTEEIAAMAHGGLLMEIASRPLPRRLARAQKPAGGRMGAVLLAAGLSSRMGDQNKMLAELDGAALVRHAAQTLAAAGLTDIVVVTGPQPDAIAAVLEGLPVRLVRNPDFASGQASSIRVGLVALGAAGQSAGQSAGQFAGQSAGQSAGQPDAVLVALGDMPFVKSDLIEALIAAHQGLADSQSRITLPSFDGRRGNPVIWGRSFFEELASLSGDTGGRALLAHYPAALNALGWPDPSIHQDIDTAEELAAARAFFD
jgi:molybdenum cofactor cytidylyltransferase